MRRAVTILVIFYLVGYAVIRTANAEVWEKDGQTYVIFPKNPVALYYAYRPMTYLDSALTGMRFHIGPHEGSATSEIIFSLTDTA